MPDFSNLNSVEAAMVEGGLTILRGPRSAPMESVLKYLLRAWEEIPWDENPEPVERRDESKSVPGF